MMRDRRREVAIAVVSEWSLPWEVEAGSHVLSVNRLNMYGGSGALLQ
jgi:hypothetical protein